MEIWALSWNFFCVVLEASACFNNFDNFAVSACIGFVLLRTPSRLLPSSLLLYEMLLCGSSLLIAFKSGEKMKISASKLAGKSKSSHFLKQNMAVLGLTF